VVLNCFDAEEQLARLEVKERLAAAERWRRDRQVIRRVRAQKTLQRAVAKGLKAGMDLRDVKLALAPILHRCRGR
jgi:hypothetical protein